MVSVHLLLQLIHWLVHTIEGRRVERKIESTVWNEMSKNVFFGCRGCLVRVSNQLGTMSLSVTIPILVTLVSTSPIDPDEELPGSEHSPARSLVR